MSKLSYNTRSVITEQTLEALRAGSQQAFEAIYFRYVSPVKGFLSALVRSDDVGAELTQALFVVLWEKRESIDPAKNISGYMYTIARNLAFKYLIRRRNANTRELSDADRAESTFIPDQGVIEEEINSIIEATIDKMPLRQREVYLLSRKEGLGNQEIAERLQISKNTVENHITSALKDLRKIIGLFAAIILMLGELAI